ncbi:hypothetical protein OIU77_026063, partial [Salix suchowensis]
MRLRNIDGSERKNIAYRVVFPFPSCCLPCLFFHNSPLQAPCIPRTGFRVSFIYDNLIEVMFV